MGKNLGVLENKLNSWKNYFETPISKSISKPKPP